MNKLLLLLLFCSAVLASRVLGEQLNILGKLGCVLCCCGSVVLVMHAPKAAAVTSRLELEAGLSDPGDRINLCLFHFIRFANVCVHWNFFWTIVFFLFEMTFGTIALCLFSCARPTAKPPPYANGLNERGVVSPLQCLWRTASCWCCCCWC